MDTIINVIWFSLGVCIGAGIVMCILVITSETVEDYEYRPMASFKDKGEE